MVRYIKILGIYTSQKIVRSMTNAGRGMNIVSHLFLTEQKIWFKFVSIRKLQIYLLTYIKVRVTDLFKIKN